MPLVPLPGADEYGPFYAGYIARLPADADILDVLARQQASTAARFAAVPADRAGYRYAPGKWSVRELLVHLSDAERIMAYRALRVARGDATPLPGFDEDAYAPLSNAEAHPIAVLAEAWSDVRRATLSLFRLLPADAWSRRGTANGAPVTARALAWIIAGHERHHLQVLGERYGV
jgi:hypothetical protein